MLEGHGRPGQISHSVSGVGAADRLRCRPALSGPLFHGHILKQSEEAAKGYGATTQVSHSSHSLAIGVDCASFAPNFSKLFEWIVVAHPTVHCDCPINPAERRSTATR